MNRRFTHKNSLSRKFLLGITTILLFTLLLSLLINTRVIERYYLYRQRTDIRQTGQLLETALNSGIDPDSAILSVEQEKNVLITYAYHTSAPTVLSNDLREKFRQKGLGFQKYWLWEQDYDTAVKQGRTMRLYQQNRLNYGILVEYLSTGEQIFAIASVVPNTAEVVLIINQFLVILHVFSLGISILLVFILVRHITIPLKQMEDFSAAMARQQYKTLSIQTNDELETVADSMNQMSQSIQQYQNLLAEKNRQMELLLDNVAHDLKTPISLIRMYASGIQDGLDDGTFLNVIIQQNEKMAQLTERLLSLSRIGQKSYVREPVKLGQLLLAQIKEYQPLADSRSLSFTVCADPEAMIVGNKEFLETIISNLLTNACHYSAGQCISLSLQKTTTGYEFLLSNEIEHDTLDLERIWEPFYVGETSRNKALSGTGLGLAMIRRIADQEGYQVHCQISGQVITFQVIF